MRLSEPLSEQGRDALPCDAEELADGVHGHAFIVQAARLRGAEIGATRFECGHVEAEHLDDPRRPFGADGVDDGKPGTDVRFKSIEAFEDLCGPFEVVVRCVAQIADGEVEGLT